MPRFDSGVSSYIKSYAVVEVNFPVDDKGRADVSCKQCPYLSTTARICQLNKEPVAYPDRYVGHHCPLNEIEKEEE